MPLYERVDEHGQVTERVRAGEGGPEQQRLKAEVARENSPWRVAGAPTPPSESEPERKPSPRKKRTS